MATPDLDPEVIFAQALATVRDRSALARALDTTPSTVSRWLNPDPHQRNRPEVGSVLRLAKVTGNPPAATLRAFGYDPDVLGVSDDEPDTGSRSARASAIAAQMEDLPPPVQDWVLVDLLPRLRTMKPPPTWHEDHGEQTPVRDENTIGNYAYQDAQSHVFASRPGVRELVLGAA